MCYYIEDQNIFRVLNLENLFYGRMIQEVSYNDLPFGMSHTASTGHRAMVNNW